MQAVAAAKGAWGERQLPELEAEDRLAIACERAPNSDPVIAKLRAAFQVCHLATCPSHRRKVLQDSLTVAVWSVISLGRMLTSLVDSQRLEADYKAVTDKEKAEVVQLGGLHVVGTERHVSLSPLFPCLWRAAVTVHAHCYIASQPLHLAMLWCTTEMFIWGRLRNRGG